MISKLSFGLSGAASLIPARSMFLAMALAAAGCSADVTRFDSNSFAFDDPPETASIDTEKASNVYDAPVVRNAPPGPYGAGANSVDSEPLAPPVGSAPTYQATPAAYDAPSYEAKPFRTAAATAPTPSAYDRSQPSQGEMIVVERGDTLYGLSRRHRVALGDLMSANGLTTSDLRPGQKLYLPSGSTAAISAAVTPEPQPRQPSPVAAAPAVSAPDTSNYNASYTVQPGDSLYAIALSHGVKSSELQSVNGITDPRRIRPGTVLRVPGASVSPEPEPRQVAALNETVSDAPSVLAPVAQTPPPVAPRVVAKAPEPAAIAPAAIEQSSNSSKLRWPVVGKVIAGFGGRPDGTHNDGINIDVPLGSSVHAAEAGVVAYAGSELKGYGNLVLIRHENGWVTAYAHNDELLVKRGDKVGRGQVIGKAGKTGSVDRPQLHFELRQGSKPVDPRPHMEPT